MNITKAFAVKKKRRSATNELLESSNEPVDETLLFALFYKIQTKRVPFITRQEKKDFIHEAHQLLH